MVDIDRNLQLIKEQIQAAQAHLEQIKLALNRIEQAGMYPGVPVEQWEARNHGGKKYLYMIFKADRNQGGYQGPGRKRKLYVGNKPEAIAEARRLARNSEQWEDLSATAHSLERWIYYESHSISMTAQTISFWPKAELGPDIADNFRVPAPK